MSAKNTKKKNSLVLILITMVASVILFAIGGLLAKPQPQEPGVPAETNPPQESHQESAQKPAAEVILREAIQVNEIGDYIGVFMEDGSDEVVADVLKLKVTNISEEPIQFAEIVLPVGKKTAKFTVTALPAGGTAILLEQNRMEYVEDREYKLEDAECTNLAVFEKELSLQEEKLEIQMLDGAINITNISGEDITQTIVLCYKNHEDDVYYGGIAYRIRMEGGLKAGELRQIMASHFHQPGSQLIFVDFVA